MNTIQTIILIFVLQLVAYALLDKFRVGKLKWLALALILVLYVFVIPPYYFPQSTDGKGICGLPALAITFGFMLAGGIATIIGNVLYIALLKPFVISRRKNDH